jgi:hypothetical protein
MRGLMQSICLVALALIVAGGWQAGEASSNVHVEPRERLVALDDGTLEIEELEDEGMIAYRFNGSGSRLVSERHERGRSYTSLGYLAFDLSSLVPLDDRRAVFLKVYADEPENLEEGLLITSDLLHPRWKGNSTEGVVLTQDVPWEEVRITGAGFALFDLTRHIKALLLYNQSSAIFFLNGENVTIGTLEGGRPAEIVAV